MPFHAIRFLAPEDLSALRSLERFIGRGIVRKRSQGFNCWAKAAPLALPRPKADRHALASELPWHPVAALGSQARWKDHRAGQGWKMPGTIRAIHA